MAYMTHSQALEVAARHHRALANFDLAIRSTVSAYRAIPTDDIEGLLSSLEDRFAELDEAKDTAANLEEE